ncbi:MAG: NAD-dependent epimerase/dehydratase family protein, partial [Candidatus Methylomirabilales bacterium]
MRVVLTGGAGFIGSHLAERLRTEGHEVLVIDNLACGSARVPLLERLGIPLKIIDIRDESVGEGIRSFRPEVIFHLAAQI